MLIGADIGILAQMHQRFGIVIGTDHWSFPAAVRKCHALGLQSAFHHPGSWHWDKAQTAWRKIAIDEHGKLESGREGDLQLLSRVQPLADSFIHADCLFFGESNSNFADQTQLQTMQEQCFGLPRRELSKHRAVFVPFEEPGIWLMTANLVRPISLRDTMGNGGMVKETVIPSPTQIGESRYKETLIIAPGNCRRHNFCLCDLLAGLVFWNNCC